MEEQNTDTLELPPGLPLPDETPDTQEIVVGHPGGRPMIGVVMKRVYRVGSNGTWEPLDDASQEVVLENEADYYEAEPPFCAPVAHSSAKLTALNRKNRSPRHRGFVSGFVNSSSLESPARTTAFTTRSSSIRRAKRLRFF